MDWIIGFREGVMSGVFVDSFGTRITWIGRIGTGGAILCRTSRRLSQFRQVLIKTIGMVRNISL
jgi:hypothetical protein